MEIKIGILLMLAGATSAFADPAYAQVAKISLDTNSERLESVMDEIENKSEFYFIFNQKQIDVNRVIDIEVKDKLIDEILAELFSGTNVNYEVFDRKILLTTEPIENDLLKSLGDNPQQQAINGTVTDVLAGEALPGVNVVVKGTVNGVLTDVNGKYSLFVPDPQATLVFSFIGYSPQEIPVAGQKVIDVKMAQSLSTLDEVVVIGYGTQKKVSLTGAVSSIGEAELSKVAVGDAVSRLQGQIAGVYITSDNRPGNTASIRVRGYGSLGNNNPLFVIDGVPRGSMDNINPNEIESMTVLKDASSAAIYGSRAANGVVLVTTKRGTEGRTKLTFSMRQGVQFTTNKPDLMNAQEVGENLWQKFKNMGLSEGMPGWGDTQYGYGAEPRIPDYIFPAGKMEGEVDESKYTPPNVLPYNAITRANKGDNLWDQLWWQGAPVSEYNLNMSGGNGGSTYSLTVGYNDQKSLYNFSGDDINGPTKGGFKRYSIRSNNDLKVNNWLKISPNLNVTYMKRSGNTGTGSGSGILSLNPLLPVYDIMGNYAGSKIPATGNGFNPVATLVRSENDFTNTMIAQASTTVQISFTKNLIFRSLLGANLRSLYGESLSPANPEFNQTNNTASMSANSSDNFQYNWVNSLNYMKTINGNHNFNVLLGTETLDNSSRDLGGARSTYAFENLDFMVLSAGTKDITNSGSRDRNRLFSYFGRLNYDYKGKYLFEGVLRRDASSRFIGDYRWGTFPAFSAGWRISAEPFMKELTWINDLKIRAGWGENGNDNVGNYNAYSTFSARDDRSFYNITGASRSSIAAGFSANRIGNPQARWETGVSKNLGLDLSLFMSKIVASLDLYDRRTSDMLYNDTRPGVWGIVNLPQINIGEMKNTGFDLAVTYNGGQRGSDFSYKVSATLSHFKNEVVKLNLNPNEIRFGTSTEAGNSTATQAGHPIESFYGYVIEGYFNTQEDIDAWPKYNPSITGVDTYTRLGVMKFKDISGPDGKPDGIITPLDRTWLGDGFPDLNYGLNVNLTYKQFDMTFFLQGLYGRDIIRNYERTIVFIRQDGNYLRKRLYESWTPERYANGEKITVPITINTDAQMQLPNSWFISNGSFARMKDIQIGYTLPNNLLTKLKMTDLRVYGQISNLFTITKYEGLDPEVSDLGIDNSVYPTPRVFTFGITLSL